MSTTVIDVPDSFDESSVNQILGSPRFDRGELHKDEVADLWGFVKYFYQVGKGIDVNEFPTSEFAILCDKVEKQKIRYEIGNIGPSSPNKLATDISENQSEEQESNLSKSRDINLDRLKRNNPPVIPEYAVRTSENGRISVIFDDEVYLSDSNEIVGKDCFSNEYRVKISNVHEDLSEDHRSKRSYQNGITTLVFETG